MSGRVDPKKLARAIETELERTGSPERAAGEKRYLKSDMYFLGATLADIRRVAWKAATDSGLDRDGAVRLVEELWSAPTFERRMAAAFILELHADDLRSEDRSALRHRRATWNVRRTVEIGSRASRDEGAT